LRELADPVSDATADLLDQLVGALKEVASSIRPITQK
jgi:hypothetical protein